MKIGVRFGKGFDGDGPGMALLPTAPTGADLLDLGAVFDLLDLALEQERSFDDEHEDDGGTDLGEEHDGFRGEDREEDDESHDELDDNGDDDEADDEVNEGVHGGEVVVELLEAVPATGTLPHSRQRDGRASSSSG